MTHFWNILEDLNLPFEERTITLILYGNIIAK